MFAYRAEPGPDSLRGFEFVRLTDSIGDHCEIALNWVALATSDLIEDFVTRVAPIEE